MGTRTRIAVTVVLTAAVSTGFAWWSAHRTTERVSSFERPVTVTASVVEAHDSGVRDFNNGTQGAKRRTHTCSYTYSYTVDGIANTFRHSENENEFVFCKRKGSTREVFVDAAHPNKYSVDPPGQEGEALKRGAMTALMTAVAITLGLARGRLSWALRRMRARRGGGPAFERTSYVALGGYAGSLNHAVAGVSGASRVQGGEGRVVRYRTASPSALVVHPGR